MAEVIAALIAALFELMAAALQLCVELVALVLESLGFAAGHLADKPKEGEPRFSPTRLLVAFVPLALTVFVLVGTFGFFHWRAEVRRARQRATRELVEEHADRFASKVDDNGHFQKHFALLLDADDAWGNPVRIEYKETLSHEVLVVRSAGDDQEFDTPDDVSSLRRLLRPKKEIAKDVLGKVKDAIKDRIAKPD